MHKTIIGVDPGISGAIAIIDLIGGVGKAEVFDMPVMPKNAGKGNQVNAYELSRLLIEAVNSTGNLQAYVERVSAMPGQGVTSMFSFGESVGVIKGILGAFDIPCEFPTPQSWKKHFGLIKKDKDFARTLAVQKFPYLSDRLSRKKDCGRADALLIALYGVVNQRG